MEPVSAGVTAEGSALREPQWFLPLPQPFASEAQSRPGQG